jgi:cellulose synthase operon protein C
VTHQTPRAGGGGCVRAETLAAYLDNRLNPGDRAAVEAHLADCDDCRESAVGSFLAQDDEAAVSETVVPTGGGSRRRVWPLLVGLAAAAVVVLAVLVPRLREAADPSARPELRPLVDAVGENRPFEPRLTGGFKYGPLAPVMRSGEPRESDAAPEIRIAAAELQKAHEEHASTKNAAAFAASELVLGRFDVAIGLLDRAAREKPTVAAYWSDLSAAYLVRAARMSDAAAAQQALAAADRALALAPGMPEALFNRAMAAEALGRIDDALVQWRTYRTTEPDRAWLGSRKEP